MVFFPENERPVEIEGVPDEEGVDEADAVERLDLDPEEQENYPGSEQRRAAEETGGQDPSDPDEL